MLENRLEEDISSSIAAQTSSASSVSPSVLYIVGWSRRRLLEIGEVIAVEGPTFTSKGSNNLVCLHIRLPSRTPILERLMKQKRWKKVELHINDVIWQWKALVKSITPADERDYQVVTLKVENVIILERKFNGRGVIKKWKT